MQNIKNINKNIKKFNTNSDLFFLCSLIEFIGRERKFSRKDVVNALGDETLRHIYQYADVLHCELIAKVADEFINLHDIKTGVFDNIKSCKYTVPSYWDIGKVYSRLIQDLMIYYNLENSPENVINTLNKVYNSWISDSISNFNSDFFYQPHDYIRECYLNNKIL